MNATINVIIKVEVPPKTKRCSFIIIIAFVNPQLPLLPTSPQDQLIELYTRSLDYAPQKLLLR